MSWFDSSFSFAKTALTQAQKSLDKVLDIKEDQVKPDIDEPSSFTTHPSAPSTLTKSETAPITQETSQSQLSSKALQPKPSQDASSRQKVRSDSPNAAAAATSTPKSTSTSGLTTSTWGGTESFWSSPFAGPSPTESRTDNRDRTKKGAAKRAARHPSSKSIESEGGKSAKSANTSLNRQSSRGAESATTPRNAPQSRKRAESVSGAPQSSDDSGVKSDTRGQLGGMHDELTGGPAMTSTPVTGGDLGGRHRRDNLAPSRGETEAPISPLSSTNGGVNDPISDPGLITSAESASAPGVDATDSISAIPMNSVRPLGTEWVMGTDRSAEMGSGKQVVGTNRGAEMASGKLNDTDTSPIDVRVDLVVDSKEMGNTKQETSPEGVTLDAQLQATCAPEGRSTHHKDSELEMEAAPATLEVSPTVSPAPATLEVTPTVDKHLEVVSPGLDTVGTAKDAAILATDPQSSSSKPLEVETTMEVGGATTELDRATTEVGGATTEVGGATMETGGATSPLHTDPVVSPTSVGEFSSRDNEENLKAATQEEGDHPAETPTDEVIQKLRKEMLHAQQVLEIREQKMMLMSQQIVDQMEANQTLQSELMELRGVAQSDVQELREEFTKRVGTSEKKLQGVTKERDSLKKQLTAFQNEQIQQKRSEGDEMSKVLSEKDEKIAQLMEEGEKLSKQELQSNGIIKKLRQRERQNDQLLAAQRQQVEDLEGKVKSLKDQVKKKEETEKKYQESLAQLNAIAEQQARELGTLKTERDGLQERVRSLQTNLDNSYKELADLQKANAVNKSVAQEAAASAEMTKQAEVKVVLEQQKIATQKEKEALIMQIEELRMSVSRAEQQLAWKEDRMNQEIANIQTRLQEADDRNQELTSTISQATKPLLRQIENLQSAHATQSANWEKVETNLNRRLVDAQTQLNVALEKERSAVEQHMILKSRVGALESQLSSVKQEKSHLLATVELERAKLETLEESQHRESSKLEALRASYQQSIEGLRKEKEVLERQLEYERVRLEAESRKACLESQEKERLRSQLANSLSSLNRSISRQSSNGSQNDYPDRGSQSHENNRTESSSGEIPLLGTQMRGGSAVALEHLRALLKQKEGELANVQNLSGSLERSRAAMAEDLAKISAQNEVLNQQVEKIPFLQKELEDVRKKHEAMLQMYGEKAEEAEELKLDIDDLKSMYRQQIDELVSRRRH